MARATGHGGRDYPDYIQATTPHQNPIEITLAELAVRMGFPHVFERTGNVLFYETYQYGISDWFPSGSHASNYPVLASHGLLNSPYSCKLQIAVSGAAYSQIAKDVAYPYLTTYGFELAFRPLSEFGTLLLGYQVYTGTQRISVWARYNDVENKWYIYDENGTFQEIATYPMGTWDISVWHPVKVVVDLDNLKYARFSYDANDISLSSYGLEVVASAVTPRLTIGVSIGQVGTELSSMYIDNVILTINEPI
ncbi:MAG: hypothetical protein GWN13_03805 [Phycisphaerae bacterium]|nr:hypothetical protein [Phycisphaerae bacterium]